MISPTRRCWQLSSSPPLASRPPLAMHLVSALLSSSAFVCPTRCDLSSVSEFKRKPAPCLPTSKRTSTKKKKNRINPLCVSNQHDHLPGGTQVLKNAKELENAKESSLSLLEKGLVDHISLTGGAFDFAGVAKPLVPKPLGKVKRVVFVRHGLSSWNEESRIQGSSDASVLSEKGILQALDCKRALSKHKFDQCFASPISRAKSSAELIWEGQEGPLIFLDTLKEAHLHFLEGMKNELAKEKFPDVYKAWRQDPMNFCVEGVYPVVELWGRAVKAWEDMLSAEGQSILVVTHKSILRALICTALGMGPDRFRAIDINNGGISTFTVNEKGHPMLQNLNMTSHLFVDEVYY